MIKCCYCTEDAEGYVMHLPREGTGIMSFISNSIFKGPVLVIRGPNNTRVEIRIGFCPICGAKMEGEDNEQRKAD